VGGFCGLWGVVRFWSGFSSSSLSLVGNTGTVLFLRFQKQRVRKNASRKRILLHTFWLSNWYFLLFFVIFVYT